ncbi:MAG: penicillin-binding protein 2 [Microbacteriaceae bacterium]|nr:penicillin-binding protein 2 [Microbacteriaceae bacterium]
MLIVVAFFAVVVVRLIDIQIVRAAEYDAASAGKMSLPATVFAPRGDITDANGIVLADAILKYDVTMSPRNAREFERGTGENMHKVSTEEAAMEIASITGQKPEDILGAISSSLTANPNADFAYVTRGVGVEQFRALNQLEIPWLYFEQIPSRAYPNGSVAGNLLGYVGSDGTALAGLELTQDSCLAGENGQETYERGADGVRIPGSTVTSVQAKQGSQLRLTIDSDLQWYAQQVLATQAQAQDARFGIAVVLEVKTGKLRAVADYPSVDPNNVDATPEQYRGSYAFAAPYEPGSTMKSLTAAMVVDTGMADHASRVEAPSLMEFANGARVKDSSDHDPNLTLQGVLVESSNVGMSLFGEGLSPDQRFSYMTKFGLGQPTAVGFLGESAGILYDPEQWDNQTYYNMFFGQGLAATAVQMAGAYQAIGNNGIRLPVRLVEECTSPDGAVTAPSLPESVRVVSASAAQEVTGMLEGVVTNGWLGPQLTIPGYRVAAKTGTAEMSAGDGTYSTSFIVSIAGLIPAEDPQYVVLVTLANPSSNSTAAVAPVIHDLMEQVVKQYRIQPSTSNSPYWPVTY